MTASKKTTPPAAKAATKPAKKPAGKKLAPTDLVPAGPKSTASSTAIAAPDPLLTDLRTLILTTRENVAQVVNSGLTTLYWEMGRRIRQDVLLSKRAGYGEQIVAALGRHLEQEFGRGFGEKNLHRMIQFATVFPDEEIFAALRRHLGWTHFKAIIPMADPLKRDFYAEMCRIEQWSTRTLEKKIGGMLFERTALSKKPAKLAAMELQQLRDEDK